MESDVFAGQLRERPKWWLEANCLGTGTENFFGERGYVITKKVQEMCGPCASRIECLEFAIRFNIKDGYWGGLSYKSRRGLGVELRTHGNLNHIGLEVRHPYKGYGSTKETERERLEHARVNLEQS